MATFTLEDLRSSIEVMVFPKMMAEVGHLLADDVIVITSGRIDRRDDTPKLVPLEVSVFEPVVDASPPLRLQLSSSRLDDATLGRLRTLFTDFPGESEVLILLDDRDVVRLGDDFLVSTQSGLVGELRALLGHAAVTV
jgi:DNA polymerase-3 subunit alpha